MAEAVEGVTWKTVRLAGLKQRLTLREELHPGLSKLGSLSSVPPLSHRRYPGESLSQSK